jgi:valyl-tRNA synthetase
MSNGGSYDPHAVEQDIYRFWEEGGYFHAAPNADRPPYVIDIPLPNITGALHMGHALNDTVQDMLIRYHRMRGYEALWMPGTDHAGIATQAVVERKLKEEQNLTRHELGREGLVAKIWQWKEDYGGRILRQLRALGASCDWERTRFTLDEVCAKAVYEVFFQWFKAGLIYRGERLVNWDAFLQTAVADDEIVHEKVKGSLWHIRYPLEGGKGTGNGEQGTAGVDYLIVATTRPETMLGDTAIAVHPSDPRYKHLIGKHVVLPLVGRKIPIIGDALLVSMEFGTGCVKVTPAHDPNDYAFSQRHPEAAPINILTKDGKINDVGRTLAGAAQGGGLATRAALGGRTFDYVGLDRYDARKKVVADLEALGLLEKIEPYENEVGHSDRSKTPIEPMLSEQWFVKMADLAETAMEAVRDGRVQFFPERYAKTYLDWLGEKRDWCISRQLWWGHRIPVWSRLCVESEAAAVVQSLDSMAIFRWNLDAFLRRERQADGRIKLMVCLRSPSVKYENIELARVLEHEHFEQDPDVLDTWFSSALWPFSTLGWPDNYGKGLREQGLGDSGKSAAAASPSIPQSLNPSIPTDLSYFYPTTVLVTARDIITLWVARMVMTGLYFQGRVPFAHVHIHPNIQDSQGRRMSKSLGNGVDPLDIIHMFGTDALRFTMAQIDSETQDARLPVMYLCPHCQQSFAQATEHLKKPVIKCKLCKKEFATRVAGDADIAKHGLGVVFSDRFEMGRNFCNKIWQAATGFVLPNIAGLKGSGDQGIKAQDLEVEDRWILSRLADTVERIDARYARYQLNDVASALYDFFWGDLCDWYLELVKPRLFERSESGEMGMRRDASADVARRVLAFVLDQALRLMHPVMPFISEALWKKLGEVVPRRGLFTLREAEPVLIRAAWPRLADIPRDPQVELELAALQNVIRALRDTLARINTSRAAAKQPAIGKLPAAVIRADVQVAARLAEEQAVLERLGRCERVQVGADAAKPPESATQVLPGVEVYVPLSGLMDLAAERKRLTKERDELRGHIERLVAKLGNEGFVAKAPAAVIETERARLAEMQGRLVTLERNVAELE